MNGKIKQAFSHVHADEALKQKTLEGILSAAEERPRKRRIPLFVKLAPIAAVFALFVLGGVYMTPSFYVSIDINPSIELSVNAFDIVISASAKNRDAAQILDTVKLDGLNYVEAMEQLKSTDSFETFSESHTEVTVISASEENSQAIINSINSSDFAGEHVHCFLGDSELRQEAESADISFGKYRAYLELLELAPSTEVADIRGLPMRAIRDMIENGGVPNENAPQRQGAQGENAGQGAANGQGAGAVDNDGDGVPDNLGTGRGAGNGQGAGAVDNDGDGVPDKQGAGNGQGAGAMDNDGDGVPDRQGAGNGQDAGAMDNDGDGVPDNLGTGRGAGNGQGAGSQSTTSSENGSSTGG